MSDLNEVAKREVPTRAEDLERLGPMCYTVRREDWWEVACHHGSIHLRDDGAILIIPGLDESSWQDEPTDPPE